jgi:hypothetical protein
MDTTKQPDPSPSALPNWQAAWGQPLKHAVCPNCQVEFLAPESLRTGGCPNCYRAALDVVAGETQEDSPDPAGLIPAQMIPELVLPPQVNLPGITTRLQAFVENLWFAPADLNPNNLLRRLCLVYLPVWLVDSQVQADWRAQAGFNYQVVSHQDQYNERVGGWRSREVTETRQRWEPRLGHLKRAYQNISAPALEEHRTIMERLQDFDTRPAKTYDPSQGVPAISSIPWVVELPNRSPHAAFDSVTPGFRQAAAEECRQACGADFMREFDWDAQFDQTHWTLLLLPMLTSFYTEDDQQVHVLMMNAQNGRLSGTRRASMLRARTAVLWILAACILVFLASLAGLVLGAVVPVLLPLAAIGIFLAVLLGVSALIPIAIVWSINRRPGVPRRAP